MKYIKKTETITTETGRILTAYIPDSPDEHLYYLQPPPEETYKKQIEDLVTKMFIQDHNAKLGRLRYQFDLREMLTVNEVTSSMKADILKCMVELKSRKPFSDYGNYSDLKERVEAFDPIKGNEAEPINLQEPKYVQLRSDLTEHGFFELEMVKEIHHSQREILFEKICANNLPYKIAMFHYLGFLDHLEGERFEPSKNKLCIMIGGWFGIKGERSVKGNWNVLEPYSKERNRGVYTAHNYIETVKKDYEALTK